MAYKDPLRVSLSGDPANAAPHIRTARALAHGLLSLNGASGASVGRREIITADGTKITVQQNGNDISAKIAPQGGMVEEVVSVFFTSDEGLRVVDLGRKKLTQTIAGLDDYNVDGTSPDGRFVYLTAGALGITARVDRVAETGFGMAYEVDTLGSSPPTGIAGCTNMDVSPDARLAVVRFNFTYEAGVGTVLDGLGGLILIDTTTLEAVRPAIRMSYYRGTAIAWGASNEFFSGASIGTDPGDAANSVVGTSTQDFIARYNSDGTLIGILQVATWPFTPSTGFERSVQALACNPAGTRLYAWIETTFTETLPGFRLYAYDIEDGAFTQVATLDFPTSPPIMMSKPEMLVNRAGDRLSLWFAAHEDAISVAEIDLTNDDLSLIHRTYGDQFKPGLPVNTAKPSHTMRNGANSRLGQPADARRFFFNSDTNVLNAYKNFDEDPKYTLDMAEWNPKARYALCVTSARVFERKQS